MLPAELYNYYFNNAMLALMIVTFFVYAQGISKLSLIEGYNKANLWLFGIVITLFIGTRPISGVFVDMATYAITYERVASTEVTGYSDWLFDSMMWLMAGSFSVETFFLVCAILYVTPLAWASRRIHPNWAFAAFLAFVGSFSFFSYGTNGIRNGIATSLVVLAISFADRKFLMALLLAAAVGFHKSALLPAVAFIVSMFWSNIWAYGIAWSLALTISALFGEGLSSVIISYIPTGDDTRLEGYSQGMGLDRGGFRWDFILYSIVPVIVSYLLADRKIRADKFFRRLVSTYLIANAFWLMMMYAAYSNRFAYLSWFLLPWIIIYPFIPTAGDGRHGPGGGIPNEARLGLLGMALVTHQAFTYLMHVFIYPSTRG